MLVEQGSRHCLKLCLEISLAYKRFLVQWLV